MSEQYNLATEIYFLVNMLLDSEQSSEKKELTMRQNIDLSKMKSISRRCILLLICCSWVVAYEQQPTNTPSRVDLSRMSNFEIVRGIQSVGLEEYLVVPSAGMVSGGGLTGATGATGSNGQVTQFLYAKSDNTVDVLANEFVPFAADVSLGVSDLGSGKFLITDPGFYLVTYSVSRRSGGQISGTSFQLMNMAALPTPVAFDETVTFDGSWSGILVIQPGTMLALKNISVSTITDIYATLNIVQLTSGNVPV